MVELEFPTKLVEEPRFNGMKSYGGTCRATFSREIHEQTLVPTPTHITCCWFSKTLY
jgi:hypothetical protein